MKRWRVRFYRWEICEIRDIEAPTEAAAEERGMELYEQGHEYAEIDGGTEAAYAEEDG